MLARLNRLLLVSLVALMGCSSADESDGAGSVASRVCARQIQDGCEQDAHSCEYLVESDQKIAAAFGCSDLHDAYLECSANNAWSCDPGAIFPLVATPPACDEQKAAFESCQPVCQGSSSGGGDSCSLECMLDGKTLALDCPNGPASCSCTSGPNTGKQLAVSSCDMGELAKQLSASCR